MRFRPTVSRLAPMLMSTSLTAWLSTAPVEAKPLSLTSATVSGQRGFDTSDTPSKSAMNTWWTYSPYFDVGVYLGGENYSGDNSNLTSSWVNTVTSPPEGWNLIPIWVGLQAPCTGFAHRMSTNTTTARSQGVAGADSAVSAAKAVGINAGTIIYGDMEGYDSCDPGTSQPAVDAFVDGFVSELHVKNYSAGMYGSTCGSNVLDWASINNVPNDVYGAYWNGVNTVWGWSCVDDTWWNGLRDRRVHQYQNLPNGQTYNGVTIKPIDQDCENGLVAGPNHSEGSDDESLGGTVEDASC